MAGLPSRIRARTAIAVLALCWLVQPSLANADIDHTRFLDDTESLRTKDHPQFVQRLHQIHSESSSLTTADQWRLRYLDAWEAMFEGEYSKSEVQFDDIIKHSGDTTLVTKASALLLSNLAFNRRYEEAFALANRLATTLPTVTDPLARATLLTNLSQMMNFAGQPDLAFKYADMAENAVPPGETACRAVWYKAAALFSGKRLKSSSPELRLAVDTCAAGREKVTTDSALLLMGTLLLEEGQPQKAMALLDRIEPSIRINHYFPNELSAQLQRAQAYEKLGNDSEAKKAALALVAMNGPNDISDWLREAYEILYRVEKRKGNAVTALSYYEHFVAQDKGYLNDVGVRSLAYQVSQQHQMVQTLATEGLSRQNRILRLQQALDANTVATGRLYIALLLVVLASIGLLLFRVKRSQLRFKRMSSLDGLTGILNHQHFMSGAERMLRVQEKKVGSACLISIDLDHFKQVNDTHGHAMGDIVLQYTVAVLQEHLRPSDLFGRLGGEEFGILLAGCSSSQAVATAQRLRVAIEASPVTDDGRIVPLSVSVGVASTDRCGYVLARLCREADTALYRAKRAGRNRVVTDAENDTLTAA
ncbi:diguanylate cyclase (GGDEF)-like protein [Luteibacter sp. OK325]|uniref:GGDEF domain-containing protein n=1 Tax=Luteibacter sp. OK325 TaxID=2135670 RepID=UPI000D4E09CA|nr:GGDEF domain-containing protein [Luteibacter sp. OK325]PTR32529.1 diguanylate cyclase (GGDEF)-like protein [Luteibacter sp. OK325]